MNVKMISHPAIHTASVIQAGYYMSMRVMRSLLKKVVFQVLS